MAVKRPMGTPINTCADHTEALVTYAKASSSLSLGKVSRSPRTVQVMKCHQTVLHIGACAHLGGAAQKDTHLTGTCLLYTSS